MGIEHLPKIRVVIDVTDNYLADISSIEDLRREDVAASIAGDFDKLKSLMDKRCIVLPPGSEPESGQVYLDRAAAATKDVQSQEQILELTQDWEELELFGDFAFERGVVRYAVQDVDGKVVRETRRLLRMLRRQKDGTWRVYRAMWHEPQEA